jgi:hypothetical protein
MPRLPPGEPSGPNFYAAIAIVGGPLHYRHEYILE